MDNDRIEKDRIEKEMHELEHKIQFTFNDIELLAKAMNSCKIKNFNAGKNHKEYCNESLATVGDSILHFVITDEIYKKDSNITKGKLTTLADSLENNATLYEVDQKEEIIKYAYNKKHFNKDPNIPDHEKVVHKKHDPYIEAIVGAIYYDQGYEKVKSWINTYLYPLLEKYKKQG